MTMCRRFLEQRLSLSRQLPNSSHNKFIQLKDVRFSLWRIN